MKKIIFFCLFLFVNVCVKAQSGTIAVVNHADFPIQSVDIYGYSASTCVSGTCSPVNYDYHIDFIWWIISGYGSSTFGPYDPCSLTTVPGSSSYLSVCFPPCPAPPADFQWAYAAIVIATPCGPVNLYVGDNTLGCYPSVSPIYACGTHNFWAKWSPPTGGPLANVVVDVYMY